MNLSRLSMAWAGPIVLALSLLSLPVGAQDAKPEKPDATIEIEQAQFALLASINAGGGKLTFNGKTYEFEIGGLGIGGIGIADIKAKGEVFHLTNVEDFFGVYGEARTGYAVANKGSGNLWLENTKGVVLEIDTEADGLILSLGADGVLIKKR